MKNFLLLCVILYIAILTIETAALITESMDTTKTEIGILDPKLGSMSSGILKSHIIFDYRTNWNKTLTLAAPDGCGINVAIRLLDLRPSNLDKLKLFSPSSVTPPIVFSNPSFFRNRSDDSYERVTVNAPSGRVNVNFETGPGSSRGYGGFELIYTAYANDIICGFSQYRCWNNRCIANSLTCDGHNHCGDRSDQKHCPVYPYKPGKRTIPIVIGSVFAVTAIACIIFLAIRRARRSTTSGTTIIHPPPNPQAYPNSYPQSGSYCPPPPPPYTKYNQQGYANAGY